MAGEQADDQQHRAPLPAADDPVAAPVAVEASPEMPVSRDTLLLISFSSRG